MIISPSTTTTATTTSNYMITTTTTTTATITNGLPTSLLSYSISTTLPPLPLASYFLLFAKSSSDNEICSTK
jgi:hypothetical protein